VLQVPELSDSTLSLKDGVAVLTFDRDDVRNALTGTELNPDILAVSDWVHINHDVGVLIVTGTGRAFSSGGNVKDMLNKQGLFAGNPIEMHDGYRHGIQQMTMAMYRVEVPTIAAVNGAAIGAGFDLACMCNIRLGSEYAKVGETFVNLGIIPGDGGAWFLPRIVGEQRAAEMTFSGRILEAQEALSLGIFLELLPADQLMSRALEMAGQFAAKPREALRMSKRLLQSAHRMGLQDFLDYCASQQGLCHTSDQHHNALAEFLKK